MKVVINKCYGGFGLSEKAYEKLIEWGVPVRGYIKEPRNPNTGLYDIRIPENEGEIIFDRKLENDSKINKAMESLTGRYWDTWIDKNRSHPLLIKVVEELGEEASSRFSELKVVEIPDGTEYTIEEYDGLEHIAEKHKTWD